MAVVAFTAYSLVIAAPVDATGTLRPDRVVSARAATEGLVTAVLVTPGDSVQRGQVVVQLDSLGHLSEITAARTELHERRAALRQALTRLPADVAKRELDLALLRARRLQVQAAFRDRLTLHGVSLTSDSTVPAYQAGTHVDIDRAWADVLTNDAELRHAEGDSATARWNSLDVERLHTAVRDADERIAVLEQHRMRLVVRAPAAGVVVTETVEKLVGSAVRSGDPLLEIADLRRWQAVLMVGEREISRVYVGDRVRLEVGALQWDERRELEGRVAHVPALPHAASSGTLGGPTRYEVLVEVASTGPNAPPVEVLRAGLTVHGKIIGRRGRVHTLLRRAVGQRQ